jgi:hypothetical protein
VLLQHGVLRCLCFSVSAVILEQCICLTKNGSSPFRVLLFIVSIKSSNSRESPSRGDVDHKDTMTGGSVGGDPRG